MIERELIIKWLDTALDQPLHAKIFIPAESKNDVRKMTTGFRKELEVFYKLEPEKASTLMIGNVFKDRKFWVVIERVTGSPLVGFLRTPDGTIERLSVEYDPERERRIELMKAEGMTSEEIEELEGPLEPIKENIP